MRRPDRVAMPPEAPLLIFDGDCVFCRTWIARWRLRTGDRVAYAPWQEVASRFPEIAPEAFGRAVQLVLPTGEVLEGAEAVFATLARAPGRGILSAAYRRVPGFAALSDLAYRCVARHRSAAAALTRALWGRSVLKPTYFAATAVFVRLVGVCFAVAFVSLWVQVDGLVGAHGILPVASYLDWARAQTGVERYWLLPTLCWLSSSDLALHLLCGGGTLAALAVALGWFPAAGLAAAWLFYLSLSVAGQVFLEFQWDLLLLETGLLALFLVRPGRRRLGAGVAAPALALFLLRWLLLRLMFSSGWAKLASGDATWRNLTALRWHYETQPLPPWTAWYAHRLPPGFQTASAVFLFFGELVVPLLFFAPRRLRLFACGFTILLQVLIAATGNYAFFNLLTASLAVLLVDDAVFPSRWRKRAGKSAARASGERPGWPRGIFVLAAAVLLVASSAQFIATLRPRREVPEPLAAVARWLAPLRSANGYGLFAVMTTSRPEILIEGSADGREWRPYAFRWKPGDPLRRPRFVAPHQPRLDWQMWFAALGSYEENPWLIRLLARLLEGSPDAEKLLASNPFPNTPPRFLRAVLYSYRFTDPGERRRTGAWWRREQIGLYCPVVSRESVAGN